MARSLTARCPALARALPGAAVSHPGPAAPRRRWWLGAQRCRLALRGLAALLLLLLLAACSSRVFLYNRLPTLLPWYLDRYVELDEQQEAQLDTRIERLLRWHRSEELPRYAVLIERLEGRLDEPVDAVTVAAVTDEMETAWYRLRDRALDELLALGDTLSEAQIEEFFAYLDKTQRKYERKYLQRSDTKYRRDATANLRDFLQDYIGRLDTQQLQLIRDTVADLKRSDNAWLAERARWLAMLREELRRKSGWKARLRRRVQRWEEQLDADSLALYEHNTERVQQLIAAVIDRRSPRQDARLRRELARLRDDVLRLAQQARAD